MMRLIDANELESLFHEQIERGATDWLAAFDDALQDALTVDAVEVVRCRDCEYSVLREDEPYCIHRRGLNPETDDCFCSYGERKISK